MLYTAWSLKSGCRAAAGLHVPVCMPASLKAGCRAMLGYAGPIACLQCIHGSNRSWQHWQAEPRMSAQLELVLVCSWKWHFWPGKAPRYHRRGRALCRCTGTPCGTAGCMQQEMQY